jgi:hypothetical protein
MKTQYPWYRVAEVTRKPQNQKTWKVYKTVQGEYGLTRENVRAFEDVEDAYTVLHELTDQTRLEAQTRLKELEGSEVTLQIQVEGFAMHETGKLFRLEGLWFVGSSMFEPRHLLEVEVNDWDGHTTLKVYPTGTAHR